LRQNSNTGQEQANKIKDTPNVVKNNIKLINLNLGQTKYNYNFYNEAPSEEHQFGWSSAFKKNQPVRVKKHFGPKSNYKNKRQNGIFSTNTQGDFFQTKQIDEFKIPVTKQINNGSPATLSQSDLYFKKDQKNIPKPADGLKGLVNKFFEPNSDDEGN
jgi:hypothetical protein